MVIVSGKSWSSSLNERLKVLPLGLLSYDMTLNSELGFRPARKLSAEVAFACIFFFPPWIRPYLTNEETETY